MLDSWNEGATKSAILEFVRAVTTPGDSFVPPAERIATFDNDGTLWCEKPNYVQADFFLRRLTQMAEEDPSWRTRQPWKALYERDHKWLAKLMTHIPELTAGVTEAFEGITTEAFEAKVREFFDTTTHPTLGVPYTQARLPTHARAPRPAPGQRLPRLHLHGRRARLRARHLRGGVRHHARPRDRLGEHDRVPRRRHLPDQGPRAAHRRRSRQAGPHLAAHRAQAAVCLRQRRRRHGDARRSPGSRC